jgi:pimeloyl-ACP methyl ester carboxylesterase
VTTATRSPLRFPLPSARAVAFGSRVFLLVVAIAGCARDPVPQAGSPAAPGLRPGPYIDPSADPADSSAAGFAAKYFDVQVEGQPLRMAYREAAPAEAPTAHPPIVLLHGKNFSSMYWEATMRELRAAGYRAIAPDQIGFGLSSKPDVHYSFHLLAQLTARLLDALGAPSVVVVGHSMGGMLAARFALLYPDRVARLVLENPIGLEDYRTIVPYTDLEDQFRGELRATYASMLAYQKGYYAHWRPEYELYVRDQARLLDTGEWPRAAWASALTYEMIYTQPVVYELGRLTAPTLLVIGQSDRTVVGKARIPEALRSSSGDYPALGRRTRDAIAGAKLVEIPDCGHIPHIEAHAAFLAALLSWIR